MTGMKSGSGEDPFAESDDDEEEASGTAADSASEKESVLDDIDVDRESASPSRQQSIPYKLRRSGVKDGRDQIPVFLQQSTSDRVRETQRTLESEFDETMQLTDLREALVLAGLDNLDDVVDQLEEWGYGMTFDE